MGGSRIADFRIADLGTKKQGRTITSAIMCPMHHTPIHANMHLALETFAGEARGRREDRIPGDRQRRWAQADYGMALRRAYGVLAWVSMAYGIYTGASPAMVVRYISRR